MKYRVVVLNGVPESGKDTFAGICKELMPNGSVQIVSTVDRVKELARSIGWDGAKRQKDRKFLSDLKDLLQDYNELPTIDCIGKILSHYDECKENGTNGLTFVMCREPKNIKAFKETGAETVLVSRKIKETLKFTNHADEEVFDYAYDWFIENNGTIEDLKETAKTFMIMLTTNYSDPLDLPFEIERQTDFKEGKIC